LHSTIGPWYLALLVPTICQQPKTEHMWHDLDKTVGLMKMENRQATSLLHNTEHIWIGIACVDHCLCIRIAWLLIILLQEVSNIEQKSLKYNKILYLFEPELIFSHIKHELEASERQFTHHCVQQTIQTIWFK